MIELLVSFDKSIFLAINYLPHNLLLDYLFGLITFIGYAGLIWIFAGLILYLARRTLKQKRLITAIFIAEIFYFVTVEFLIKNLYKRLRPQYKLPEIILPFDFSHSFSFPSGHAAIAFAGCVIFSKFYPRYSLWFYIAASLIAFSRIYLGKHYPSDVVVGGLLGFCIGYLSLKLVGDINNASQY